ncbi:unnamed protein product, partial [Psylliodes chrysocephalus]
QNFVSIIKTCTKLVTPKRENSNILRVSVNEVSPFIILDNSSKKVSGFVGDIWNVIVEFNKYNYTLTSVSYYEGIRQAETGESDIFVAPVVANRHIRRNIRISQPYIINWYDLYMKSPETEISSMCYITPFSNRLWMVTSSSFILLTAVTWVTGRILKRINSAEPNISIPSCFIGVISGLMNQG